MSLRSRRTLATLAVATFVGGALALVGCSRDGTLPTSPATGSSTNAVVRLDDPGMARAIASQDRVTSDLLRQSGIIGTGVSVDAAGKPVIVVYADRTGVTGIPATIDGYATRVVVSGTVIPYAKPGSGGTLQMGTSTGNDLECAAGTLGCVVLKGGNDYFLSNNHVFARQNAGHNGERIDAPGRYDAHPICAQTPACGTLAGFQTISFNNNNTIDAAIAAPDPSRPYTQVMSSGYDPSSTVVSPAVGLAVKKTGRTSNLTHGTIEAVNVTIRVQYEGGVATFVSQIQTAGNFIRSGDSGSLMVTETGNNPVGLCFAGGSGASFANPIGPVLSAFAATVK
jgi:hypothetical protein